jgi:hypothetical protein
MASERMVFTGVGPHLATVAKATIMLREKAMQGQSRSVKPGREFSNGEQPGVKAEEGLSGREM